MTFSNPVLCYLVSVLLKIFSSPVQSSPVTTEKVYSTTLTQFNYFKQECCIHKVGLHAGPGKQVTK